MLTKQGDACVVKTYLGLVARGEEQLRPADKS